MRRGLALLVLVLGGCNLYFGDDDDVCASAGGADNKAALQRDPSTGQCVATGDPDCTTCGFCEGTGADLDWGTCSTTCSKLDEHTCKVTPGCYAAYLGGTFWECWETAPSGPVQGACTGLDAHQCSRHDDCVAYYSQSPTSFVRCDDEVTYCQLDGECGNGHCDHSTCYPCPSCPTCGACPPDTCYGVCVTHDPGSCTDTTTLGCASASPACPSGTTPGLRNGCYTGYCIPVADCGHVHDPGACGGASCTTPAPNCPAGTSAGVANGCWTGYCIPLADCGLAACSTLSTEAACIARSDCEALYTGENCSCDPNCSCQTLIYDSCQTR